MKKETEDKPPEDEAQEDTPFNMAVLFYEELHVLRELKSRAYILGDGETYHNSLDEIYTNISFKLSSTETKKIEDLFKEANSFRNNNSYKSKLKEIDKELLKLMHKYKMIFPRVTKRGLGSIRKAYGMDGG